ncbi:hypothetical protein [Amycolatopsis australiensis]|uniref:Uncharacterized protein n=1 Tax=Amycolatopsis australiensis TaxID=546364 RepID=A0A1K1RSS6_9PSEU|nr:hypothetical protein [Amycolatopsis australiensis]SFW74783.1 hypothetical protein SAMN04489730_3829 [Amycolatopsis australiensis]
MPVAFHRGGLLAAVVVVEDVAPEHRALMDLNRDELVKLLSIVSRQIRDDDPYEFDHFPPIFSKVAKTEVLPPKPEWLPGTGTGTLSTGALLATIAGLPTATRFHGAADSLHARLREAQSAAREWLSDVDVTPYTATIMVGRVEFNATIAAPRDVLRIVSVKFSPPAEEKPDAAVRQPPAPDWTTPRWDAHEFSFDHTQMNRRFINAFLQKHSEDKERKRWHEMINRLPKDPIEKSSVYFEHRYSRSSPAN